MTYKLDHATYMQTVRFIKTYPDLVDEYNMVLHSSPVHDGQPRGTGISNPTERTSIELIPISTKISAILDAYKQIDFEFREGLWNNIMQHTPYPCPPYASYMTWRRQRYKFVWLVAEGMGWTNGQQE